MEFKTAQIDFGTPLEHNQEKVFTAAFAFSQHQGSLDMSIDTYHKSNQGFSWLGVKVDPFDGWLDTFFIRFCFPHEAYGDYTVYPGNRIIQDGEWLWFPVTRTPGVSADHRQGVMNMTGHDLQI